MKQLHLAAGLALLCSILSNSSLFASTTPTSAGFTYTTNGLEVTFTDTSITSGPTTRHWYFGDGDSSVVFDPVHLYAAPGTYNVCLAIWDSCGTDTLCTSISISCLGAPAVLSQTGDTSSCVGDDVGFSIAASGQLLTYQWQEDQGGGFVNLIANTTYSGTNSDALHVANLGMGNNGWHYRCIVTNPCNDTTISDTVALAVNALPSVAAAASANSICEGDTVGLSASGTAQAFVWVPSAQLNSNTGATVSGTLTTSTTFLVTGIDTATGCSSSATAAVLVNENPTLTFTTGPWIICEGESSYVTVSGADSYVWESDSTMQIVAPDSILVQPPQTTNYLVTGTSTAGCEAFAGAIITVNPVPDVTVEASVDSVVCHWDTITLDADGALDYTWFPSTGIVNSFGESVEVSPDTTTTYYVIGNAMGCYDTANVTVEVLVCIPDFVSELKQAGPEMYYASSDHTIRITGACRNIWLFDSAGRLIWQQPVLQPAGANSAIRLPDLAHGIYLLRADSATLKFATTN